MRSICYVLESRNWKMPDHPEEFNHVRVGISYTERQEALRGHDRRGGCKCMIPTRHQGGST